MEYKGTMSRMQRSELPSTSVRCELGKGCVYRVGGLCDEPAINKGNSDAACHKMGNRALYEVLEPLEISADGGAKCGGDDEDQDA